MKLRKIALVSGWVLLVAGPLSARAAGQEASADRLFRLRGEVRDYLTEQPIEGALVQIGELAMAQTTDRNGYFEFSDVPAGEHTFITASFGYETNREPSAVGPGNIMLVHLNPIAVAVRGVSVEVERFFERLEGRRLATASAVTVFEEEQMSFSISPTLTSFVRERAPSLGLFTNPNDQLCVSLTPGSTPIRLSLFLDDSPVPTAFLTNLQPKDAALLEVFDRLGMVRIYTRTFLDRAAEAGYSPPPINQVSLPQACS